MATMTVLSVDQVHFVKSCGWYLMPAPWKRTLNTVGAKMKGDVSIFYFVILLIQTVTYSLYFCRNAEFRDIVSLLHDNLKIVMEENMFLINEGCPFFFKRVTVTE